MRAAESHSTEDCPVKMKLIAPPLYVLTTQTLDKNQGVEVLNQACEACKGDPRTLWRCSHPYFIETHHLVL